MKIATRLATRVAVTLLSTLSIAVGVAYADPPGTIAYTASCDGQSVTMMIAATGYTPFETLQFNVFTDAPPFGSVGTSASPNPVVSDANAVASATFTGLPQSTSVIIVVVELISGGGPFRSPSFTLISCSPEAQLSALVNQVQALNVSGGITNSLDAKLSHVQDALTAAKKNSMTVACNQLDAFMNEVAAQALNQTISQSQATSLTIAALSIKTALGCF